MSSAVVKPIGKEPGYDPVNNIEMVGRPDLENATSWKATSGHCLTWENLSWQVDIKTMMGVKQGTKEILNKVCGWVSSSEVSST